MTTQYEATLKKQLKAEKEESVIQGTMDSLNEPSIAMETSMMQHRTAHSNLPSYLVNSQTIKPSISFSGLARNEVRQNHFVDLNDGPSTLQHRQGVQTFKEKFGKPTVFETER